MGRKIKKGTKGAAANFISRNQALKKLQVSLPDFRRLCILKGIYPVEPNNKRKLAGGSTSDKTYYYVKDIMYLIHEPVLKKFREFKVFMKRLKKAVGKQEFSTADKIEEAKPVYKLDHIIKERYPSFLDAVRDMDDALCMVFLFSRLPLHNNRHKKELVAKCDSLALEFENYIVRTRALRKVFLSIKGIYYQAEIMGQTVTWIVPYRFTQEPPQDVDFRIMLTFLEVYTCMMGFVNFRLYNSENIRYPPVLDKKRDDGAAGLSAFVMEDANAQSKPALEVSNADGGEEEDAQMEESRKRIASLNKALNSISQNEEKEEAEEAEEKKASEEEQFAVDGDDSDEFKTLKEEEKKMSEFQSLFSEMKFFLSREVPKDSLEFVIRSFGGKVSWDNCAGATYDVNDPTITHHIIDRPSLSSKVEGRIYVQPQWVYDCINNRRVLSTDSYVLGAALPPHLSPFVVEGEDDYVPEFKTLLENETEQKEIEEGAEEDGEEENDEDVYEKELAQEQSGVSFSDAVEAPPAKKQKKAKKDNGEEEKELAKIMMPKKHKRLYERIMHGKAKKQEQTAKLRKRREELKKGEKRKA
eukprot:Nk52_evm11s262 gene=Nk52_evmTU11s262